MIHDTKATQEVIVKDSRLSLKMTPGLHLPVSLFSGADGENGESGTGASENGGGAAGNGTGSSEGAPDPKDKKIQALTEEKDRHFNAKKAVERERDDALARLKALEDAGKSDDEKKTSRLTELETAVQDLTSVNQKLAIENAFLKENTYTWQSPEVALRLADLSAVEIDKAGKVVGLKAALDKLAKDNPFLLKAKENEDENGSKPPASGAPAGGSRRGTADKGAEEQRLRQKYAALRR